MQRNWEDWEERFMIKNRMPNLQGKKFDKVKKCKEKGIIA